MYSVIRPTVEFSRRHAGALTALFLAVALGGAIYASRRIGIDSDTKKLADPNLPWQREGAELDRQFPQFEHLVVAVVDGDTPDQATDGAAELARRLKQMPDLFEHVRQPDAVPFFRRYGL